MATDHRGNTVGNPETSHGGHSPTPRLSKYGLILGNERGVRFIDTQGASIEDWKKHGPACDYCGADAGKPCLEGCQGR